MDNGEHYGRGDHVRRFGASGVCGTRDRFDHGDWVEFFMSYLFLVE